MSSWRTLVASTVVTGLMLVGCASSDLSSPNAVTTTPTSASTEPLTVPATTQAPSSAASPKPAASLTLASPMGLTAALPVDPITVTVDGGDIDGVQVSRAGIEVAGEFKASTWTPKHDLDFDSDYVVAVTTTQGELLTERFHTAQKEATAGFRVLYLYENMGIGMPAYVKFNSPVPKNMRADIQRRAIVTTVPAQEGAWGWMSDTELFWRPKTFWKPATKVTLDLKWAGVPAGKGKRLPRSVLGTFSINKVARTMKVDSAAHQMSVFENGALVRTIPVTTGKEGFTTRSGTKIVLEKKDSTRMASETIGINGGNDYYDLQVKWAMRVTWTGEFVHAAPWSAKSQGKANVSHGCVGMSTENAAWLFARAQLGDPIEFVGTSRAMQPSEGMGVWLYPWAEWQKLSALT